MDLDRFTVAQAGGAFEAAIAEIEAGAKRGHWIWFVLPQLAGLGQSEMSQRYGIGGVEEASEYLRHPVLGRRLMEMSNAILYQLRKGAALQHVMGSRIDALKLVSSMTLFERAATEDADAASFRALASEVLSFAERQGFQRCETTRRELDGRNRQR